MSINGLHDEMQSSSRDVSVEPPPPRPPANSSSASDLETSAETNYSTDDDHRDLRQSPTCPAFYESFCSTGSEDTFSCSTETTDTETEEYYYSNGDGHCNLIQLPDSAEEQLEFLLQRDDSDLDEYGSPRRETPPSSQPTSLQSSGFGRREESEGEESEGEQEAQEEGGQELCVQCHAWPEAAEHGDLPQRFHQRCHHAQIDALECAFGASAYSVTKSLSFVDKSPVAVAAQTAMETVLRAQFYSLIQQFAVDPEKVARTLYGIGVIDLSDLSVATSHLLPKLDRAKVLTVSLVRRLRRWPDQFGDVCKVLNDIPAMQEANAKVRQLLYEECSDDQYTKILEENVQQHHQSTESLQESVESIPELSNTDDIISEEERSTSHDIIAEDSVSYASKLSETSSKGSKGADQDTTTTNLSEYSSSHNTASERRITLRLHESCLENRSVRSLDALIASDEVDIDARDKNGRTPLIVACLCLPTENPNARIVAKQRKKIKSLLAKGADSSIQDYDGNTALHIATLRRDQEVLKLLLDRTHIRDYFNVAMTNKNSRTALHYACYWGEMELVMPLLELEKDMQSGLVNVRDRNGETGLHIASRGGFKAVVRELLKANANRDIQNKEGRTAADVALETKRNRIVKLLRRRKPRSWQFPRRRLTISSSEHVDGGDDDASGGGGGMHLHRSGSKNSLLSQSDCLFHLSGESDLEEMEESDTEL